MRSDEIKIGERYKTGYSCGRVLEIRVERSVGWRTNKTRKDGVKLFIEEGHHEGQEIVVASRDIHQLWDEYQQEQEERRRAQRVDQKDRERTGAKLDQAVKALEGLGIEVTNSFTGWARRNNHEYHSEIELSESSLDKLLSLLSSEEITPVEEADSNPLAELLS